MPTPDRNLTLSSASFTGARGWLSGAVPEDTAETERTTIVDFVRRFSRRVFEHGGHIVHGSHPTFTPILLEEAQRYQEQGGRKDCLVLAVSRYWSKDPTN